MRHLYVRLLCLIFVIACHCTSAQESRSKSSASIKPSLSTNSAITKKDKDSAPILINADRIEGQGEGNVSAEGDVEVHKQGITINADKVIYHDQEKEVEASGHVKITTDRSISQGTFLRYNVETKTGEFEKPELFVFWPGQARGFSDNLLILGEDKFRLNRAAFTTCPKGNDDWYLKAAEIDLDYTRDLGVARNAKVEFLGVPILASPYIDFPLANKRKSGLLAPILGTTGKNGFEITVPYYWNIAPNLDTTLYSRYMAKRGVQFNNEFRYLGESFQGNTRFEILPDDHITQTNRYGFSILHLHDLKNGLTGYVNVQKVSDDTYFTDLSNRVSITSQTYLPREGWLNYNSDWWNLLGRIQRFQVLQDPLAPVSIPYGRTPQIVLTASRPGVRGVDLNFNGEFVDFSHPTQVTGNRTTAYPSFSVPLVAPFGYIRPKIGFHATHYDLQNNMAPTPATITRTMPVFSIDSSVIFERETTIRGQKFIQTLEPRLYYLNIPFREQAQIPNFDSALADFNFAQIFSENIFIGGDRINDANQVTLALFTRLLNPENGQERLRAAVGQRLYFKSQQVTLDATTPPRTSKTSDFVAGLSGQIASKWSLDTALQYSGEFNRTEKSSIGVRYQPEIGKVVNLGYRYTRDSITQVDLSSQWPIYRNWYGVGRFNYSLRDSKVIEALGGIEYNAGCWIARFVLHRFTSATQSTTNAFFVQLELNGFSSVGVNPLQTLKRNIPGYSRVNINESGNDTAGYQ